MHIRLFIFFLLTAVGLQAATVSPPPLPSPVDSFRLLLKMTPAERQKFLADKPPEKRHVLELKLREYESLAPEEREARLHALYLRACVQQLMPLPPSNRVERLGKLPESDRLAVEKRLAEWDSLPSDLRQQVLTNRSILNIVAAPNRVRPLPPPHPGDPKQRIIAGDLARWNAISPEQREQIVEQFKKFFDELDVKQRRDVLERFSEVERLQMQRSLQAFERLRPDQRERCLVGFRKFADLPDGERREFLQNAERWQELSQHDREIWRKLVAHLSFTTPPLPPGAPKQGPRQPPAPPRATSKLLTNTN